MCAAMAAPEPEPIDYDEPVGCDFWEQNGCVLDSPHEGEHQYTEASSAPYTEDS